MSAPFEWRIQDFEYAENEPKGQLSEIDSLRNEVASLERALREARVEAAGLRIELQALMILEARKYETPA